MAGFFGFFDYTKEGPGVPVNAPPKGPFKLFFEILFRKFWKLVTINAMYVLFSLPAIALAYLIIAPTLLQYVLPGISYDFFLDLVIQSSGETISDADLSQAASSYLLFTYLLTSLAMVGLSFVVVGPVHAGVTYLFRNYAREEHAFVWMDFKEAAGSNLKQSMALGSLSIVALVVLAFDYAYFNSPLVGSVIIQGLVSGVVVIITIILSFMLMYLYPMMVTFKLSLGKMLRNAALFAIARFLPNLGILLLDLFVLLILPLIVVFATPQVYVIFLFFYYLFFAFGFTFLLNNFFVYRQLRKYMIDNHQVEAIPPKSAEAPQE
jgi:uncharacterized membrane protein YesL